MINSICVRSRLCFNSSLFRGRFRAMIHPFIYIAQAKTRGRIAPQRFRFRLCPKIKGVREAVGLCRSTKFSFMFAKGRFAVMSCSRRPNARPVCFNRERVIGGHHFFGGLSPQWPGTTPAVNRCSQPQTPSPTPNLVRSPRRRPGSDQALAAGEQLNHRAETTGADKFII